MHATAACIHRSKRQQNITSHRLAVFAKTEKTIQYEETAVFFAHALKYFSFGKTLLPN
jgi:hypothetical protein